MKTLLLLEEDEDRIEDFRRVLSDLGEEWTLKVWYDARSMMDEIEDHLDQAGLVSLNHDGMPQPIILGDPKSGKTIADFLSGYPVVCPVILHTADSSKRLPMYESLKWARWPVDYVEPIESEWLSQTWLPKARALLEGNGEGLEVSRDQSHGDRMERALLSLEGLALGDAVGEMMFGWPDKIREWIDEKMFPPAPWRFTDDTAMAISIVEVLRMLGHIDEDTLCRRFAQRFEADPYRGYGGMTRLQMGEVLAGAEWRATAFSAFSGQGSMGNGSAMRVAPLGGFFSDDLDRVVAEAKLSSIVTHTHPEGVAGAVAIAVAAAMAWRLRGKTGEEGGAEVFQEVIRLTPSSQVRDATVIASRLPANSPLEGVAQALGNGMKVTCPDTVPFAVWCAAHHLDDYLGGVVASIATGGDCDTNAAIVGGILALSAGRESIPADWRDAREPLPFTELDPLA